MADSPIDLYLRKIDQPQRATLQELNRRLRTILPYASESISYQMPAFKVDGTSVAGFAAFKKHCSFFPHSGAVLPALKLELAAYDWDAGTLRFALDKPLPLTLLRKLIRARLQLESEKAAKSGKVREFYANGVVKVRGQYKLGERVGVWRRYDARGRLAKETAL